MGKNANIKRAGQDSSNTATPSKPSAPSTAAVASATATTTAASANQWSSGSGGDVLGWLTQKTQAEAPKSRGAVEYFAKKSANNNNSKSGKTATNKGNNNNTANTTPSTANTNNNNKVAKAVHDDPNKVKTKSNTTNNASKTTAAQPPATEKKAAAPTTTSVDAWSNKDAVKQLAAMFPGKTKKEADAQLPSEAATTKKTNTPPPAPRTAATTDAKDVQRGVRGRRRKDDRATRELHRQEKEQEKAMKRHEEAMETDPEYKKQFLTYQEMQQAMQQAQSEFFQKYSKQENLLVNHVVAERLDIPVILDLIDQHDVVFICTDTGSGKSTNIPKALLELSPDTRIVSTQPRRTATVSIANRVASLRRENVGEDVGYWIRGEKRGDAQTRLWYMTSYTLLLRILENPAEFPFTHIVLDEFHERQPDVEVIVALLRLALQNKLANFKLILMSATLNTKDWEEYFTGLRVASYKQSEPEHPIHDYFLEDVCALLGTDYQTPTHALRTSVVSKDVMDKHMYLAQNLVIFLNGISSPHHSILLFLPGRAQVEMMQATLTAQLGGRVDVIPWHSAVDLGEIELAMKRITPNRQKIYVATDIAEVSITLPDVVYVVDLVLVKRPHISKDVAASLLYPPLVTQWISKGSVAQRRGRIGRVQQGFYFCILPSAAVMELPEYGEPPIENARIDELSLHCLQVVPNPAAVFSLCHGQPLVETIISSMHTLTQLGCIIDVKEPHAALERMTSAELPYSADWSSLIVENAKAEVMGAEIDEYQCTFVGRILQLIPVSPQQGMLVCFGLLTGLESLMILAAAVTSSLSPFTLVQSDNGRRRYNVARAMEETENVMRDLCCGLRSDIVAVMKATLLFCVELEKNGEKNLQTVKQWCVQKHLSFEKLQLIMDLDRHIKHELAEFMPFRTIEEPTKLLEQLDKLAAMVTVMTNVAFVAQSLEVAQEESSGFNAGQESALGLFSDMTAVPDIHSPSCLRWQEGDVIIPVQLSLFFNKLLASFSTAIETPKQFWISLLLFSHRLNYATFSDDDGTFHVFALSYGGKERFVEVDDIAGYAVLTFRQKLCSICQTLRLLHSMKELPEDELSAALARHHLKPLQEAQREVIADLVSIFKRLDDMTADEVEHDEDDLDQLTILSFALPTE